eukprot:3428866-Pleurochrysis_carterae.AAC.2
MGDSRLTSHVSGAPRHSERTGTAGVRRISELQLRQPPVCSLPPQRRRISFRLVAEFAKTTIASSDARKLSAISSATSGHNDLKAGQLPCPGYSRSSHCVSAHASVRVGLGRAFIRYQIMCEQFVRCKVPNIPSRNAGAAPHLKQLFFWRMQREKACDA